MFESWQDALRQDLRAGKLVFWVGAGISSIPPTSLPTGIDLSNAILKALCRPLPCIRDLIFREGPMPDAFLDPINRAARITGTLAEKRALRLEVVVEAAQAEFGVAALDCLNFMSRVEPNPFHNFLARQIGAGASVVTVNFDAAIESACERAGIRYDLLHPANAVPWPSGVRPQIVKLHGDIENIGSLGVTLSSFRHGLGRSLTSALDLLLTDAHVVFVGYSASDHFDISPYLAETRLRRISWCAYEAACGPNVRPFTVADQVIAPLFRDWPEE